MARKPRFDNISEGNYYHVIARGSGRKVIFEDDTDRTHYLQALFEYTDKSSGSLVAWCLMDNHVHLLFHLELHELSALMHKLHTKHGQYFNGRHEHVGPVFQGRYDCVPTDTDEQLLQTIRYIHRNPKDSDCPDWRVYPWSSYRGYAEGLSRCETAVILELLGGADEFKRFHEEDADVFMVRLDGYRRRLNDAEAVELLESHLGTQFSDALAELSKDERNRKLAWAYHAGLSVRQIERLTGIGRNIINRAVSGIR